MPAKRPTPPNEKPQFERFLEAVEKIGASDTDAALEQAIERMSSQRGILPSTTKQNPD
jgi:hypothetical protein